MALTSSYVQNYGQLPEVFSKICDGAAPERFSQQHLKDWGFLSSSYRAVIPLLKSLGFLNTDGSPSTRYHDYRNSAQSRKIMGDAVREAYSDLFTIRAKPTPNDRPLIEGKFKSMHNASPQVAKLMASTFFALLDLADFSDTPAEKRTDVNEPNNQAIIIPPPASERSHGRTTLHYNIQIHLPATKDVEVFNAIFKSLKEHLLD
ncbi:DUF5343 domain-containing protein [Massilia arenae]|uniref:DUF5343 domain-containing protein n=1 Tax=Massilia arenae TaxID=2603288 RepID=A0A5C7G5J1_9BURK|nr:DUF5343 domain-containing protein [Massilia arenae]TXF99982.1 hypothetical protein FVD38_09855 [Massilia arenae]